MHKIHQSNNADTASISLPSDPLCQILDWLKYYCQPLLDEPYMAKALFRRRHSNSLYISFYPIQCRLYVIIGN